MSGFFTLFKNRDKAIYDKGFECFDPLIANGFGKSLNFVVIILSKSQWPSDFSDDK